MPSNDATTFELNNNRISSSKRMGVSQGENSDPRPGRGSRRSVASRGQSSTELDTLRHLKRIVPLTRTSATLTKLELIQAVIDYIRYLDEVLKELEHPRSTGSSSDVMLKDATKRNVLADVVNVAP